MRKRLLDSNGVVTQYWHYDELEDKAYIQSVADVEKLIERNKYLQNNSDGYSPSRELRHVATIDLVTYERWLREAFGDYWMQRPTKDKLAVLKKRVNDPDFRNFRVVTDKI